MSSPAERPAFSLRSFASVALLATFAVPFLVFLAAGLAGGMSPAAVVGALADQCTQPRQNPLITALSGWVPVVVLLLALRITRRAGPAASRAMARGGLVAIVAVLAWANFEFWPKFLPSRVYPGFPHGLELVMGPVIFAPIAMALGMLAGRAFARGASA